MTSDNEKAVMPEHQSDTEQSLVSHLIELRKRMLWVVIALLVTFGLFAIQANDIYTIFAKPLMSVLPDDGAMISTQPHGPFFVPFKLAFFAAFLVTTPILFYQLWAFVAPGLYPNEKKLVLPLMLGSTLLFFAGIAFAYFVIFPLVFQFFTATSPDGVRVMTDINEYLGFTLKLFFAFGLAFQVPIATILLVKLGVVSTQSLANKRPYVVVGAFVMGMLFTPPDVFSQIFLALPVWLLFELGLLFSRCFIQKANHTETSEVE